MVEKDEDADPWLGADKFHHILMCFSITLLFYFLASLTSHPLLRRHAISIASLVSLLAGAAKEAADHLRFFRSSGASFKDAIADVIGVFIASLALSLFRSKTSPSRPLPQGISLL
ncbi:unnamed protein product [Vicia faba]|uniref:Uncharacterized protein n=1 Tax=Vicia faba TaxID=3906 RepID=A0AAV1ARV8_VICFA|nr:unnamed protein product [Vicia faba]